MASEESHRNNNNSPVMYVPFPGNRLCRLGRLILSRRSVQCDVIHELYDYDASLT